MKKVALSPLLLMILLLAGCTKSAVDDQSKMVTPRIGVAPTSMGTAAMASRGIDEADLPQIVVPKVELGPLYEGFTLDTESSGSHTNEQEIAEDCDREEASSFIEMFGRLNGYEQTYSNEARLQAGTGVFSVGTVVNLFKTGDSASAAFEADLTEGREKMGIPDCEGFTIFDMREFEAPSIGERAVGLVIYGGDEDVRLYVTTVWFVRDQFTAFAALVHFEDGDYRGEILRIADKLDRRILAALQEGVR